MIKIENQSDLAKLNNNKISPLIRTYIKKYFLFLCKQYRSTDLSQVGALFFLEHKKDLSAYTKLGLSVPVELSVFEFADLLTLRSATESIKLWHCCFVLTNDNAVSLFAPTETLGANLEARLKQDYTERTIQINERDEKQCL